LLGGTLLAGNHGIGLAVQYIRWMACMAAFKQLT